MQKQIFTKAITLSILLCSAITFSHSQTPYLKWQKCIGGRGDEFAQNVIKLNDGNYLVCGYTNSTDGNFNAIHGNYDAFLMKTTGSGNVIWKKTYGGSGIDAFYNMVQAQNGDIYVVGSTTSNDGQVSGNHGGEGYGDVWMAKVNSQGQLLLQHCYGGSGDEFALGLKITSAGKIVFAGSTSSNDGDVSNNQGDFDGWVVKLNSSGTINFSKTIGGAGYDDVINVSELNGSLIVGGTTASVTSNDPNLEDYFDAQFAKLDMSGNIIYYRTYGGTGSDNCNALVTTPDGNAVLVGHIASTDGDGVGNSGFNMWAWKIDLANNGNIIWNRFLDLPGSNSTAFNITKLHDGGFAVAGTSGHDLTPPYPTWDCYMVKINANGNPLWHFSFGGSQTEALNSVVEENNGSLLAAGNTSSNDGDVTSYHGGDGDALLLNIDKHGCNHRDGIEYSPSENQLSVYPNVCSTSTTISFALSQSQNISLQIFDVNGKLISTLANEVFTEGEHQIEFNAEKLNAGIYFLKMQAGEIIETKKLYVIK